MKNKVEENEIDPYQNLDIKESKSFTEAELLGVWHEYAESLKAKSKNTLYVALMKHQPVITNSLITLTLDNKIQDDEIKNEHN